MSDAAKVKSKPKDRLITFLDRLSFFQTFLLWLCVILLFAGIYFVLSWGFSNSLMYRNEVIEPNATGLLNSIYFSFITATTLGYGDIAPVGAFSKLFAAGEVVIGLIIWGLVISKLIGIKQERILEEVYDISYEEIIDRMRSGLYLFRSDSNRIIEKIESGVIKPREVRDLWIVFSGLDATLANIKNLIMPAKSEKYYYKKIDVFRLELLLNSIQLSLNKMLELIRSMKAHNLEWKSDLLLSSIHSDIGIVREIIEHESKKNHDKKVLDKIEGLRKTSWEIECEEKEGDNKASEDKDNKESGKGN
jgi:hypothetical protein